MGDKENHALLSDFGWSNIMEQVNEMDQAANNLKSFCGTAEYLAPEMITRSGHDEGLDMWMMGILLYEMVTGRTPYGSHTGNQAETEGRILKQSISFPAGMSADAQDLIMQLLRTKPKDRLRAAEAKDHLFVTRNFAGRPTIVVGPAGDNDGRPSAVRRLEDLHDVLQGELLNALQQKRQAEQALFDTAKEVDDIHKEASRYQRKIQNATEEVSKLAAEDAETAEQIVDARERIARLQEEVAALKKG